MTRRLSTAALAALALAAALWLTRPDPPAADSGAPGWRVQQVALTAEAVTYEIAAPQARTAFAAPLIDSPVETLF